MGCDIHIHIEIKYKGGWHHYSQPDMDRDYDMFSKMAGVRNDGSVDPIAPLRGIPDDVSVSTRLCYDRDEPDAHSESWLSADEISECEEFARKNGMERKASGSRYFSPFGYLFGNGFDSENREELAKEIGIEDVRAVFWFDN